MTELLPHHKIPEATYAVVVECMGHYITEPRFFTNAKEAELEAEKITRVFVRPVSPFMSEQIGIPLTDDQMELMHGQTISATVYKFELKLLPYRSLVGAEKGFEATVDAKGWIEDLKRWINE